MLQCGKITFTIIKQIFSQFNLLTGTLDKKSSLNHSFGQKSIIAQYNQIIMIWFLWKLIKWNYYQISDSPILHVFVLWEETQKKGQHTNSTKRSSKMKTLTLTISYSGNHRGCVLPNTLNWLDVIFWNPDKSGLCPKPFKDSVRRASL